MVLIALIVFCSLCRQTVADRSIRPNNEPRGQEFPFQLETPIHAAVPATAFPLSGTASFMAGLPQASPTSPSSSLSSDLPLPLAVALDGPTVLVLPPGDTSPTVKSQASGMDQPKRPLLMAYYPDWVGDDFPPENIDFSHYDWVDFAFAVPDSQFQLGWDDDEAPRLLSRLVAAAHTTGTKVKLSIGGWTGSKYFSPAVATEENRRIFASNIFSVYRTYDLDGIDIDWEYPGHEGDDGNLYSPLDTSNFLAFLKVLRLTLPGSAKISAAVQTIPFLGADGDPIPDTSEFGEVFDWILLMNYDTWEATSPPGPNAPLYDACNNSTQPASSASAGVVAWVKSGFPVSKLVLGLPSYGYVQRSSSERLRTRWHRLRGNHDWHEHEDNEKHHDHQPGGSWWGNWGNGHKSGGDDDDNNDGGSGSHGGDDDEHSGRPPLPTNPGGGTPIVVDDSDNQVQFRELVKQGALVLSRTADGTIQYVGGGGFERRWDSCSETPFLRSTGSGQIITYDDPESLALKARFAKDVGMLGVNVFDIHGDTDDNHLIDAIRDAMKM